MKTPSAKHYVQIFTVQATPRGRYFPIDMLRYDNCVPASESDALKIANTFDNPTLADTERITLRRFAPAVTQGPTVARWESFGWKVVQIGQ